MTQWTSFNLKVAGIISTGNRELDQLLDDTRKRLLKVEITPLLTINEITRHWIKSFASENVLLKEIQFEKEFMEGSQWTQEQLDNMKIGQQLRIKWEVDNAIKT